MRPIRIIVAIACTYMLFAVLMNSVGTVILQSIATFGIDKPHAATLEGFKDLSVAFASFALASLLPRLGLRRAMLLAVTAVGGSVLLMPLFPSFTTTRLLFAVTGASFGVVKVAVYASIGLITHDEKKHAALTNAIEGLFMLGVLSGYWLFGAFIDAQDPGSHAWLRVYWLLAALCALVIALLATARVDESAARGDESNVGAAFAGMLRLCARQLVLVFVLSAWLYVLVEQSIGTWLPTFNNEVLHLPHAISVQIASIFAAALAVGRLLASALLTRIRWYPLLNVCVLAMAALVLIALPLAESAGARPVAGWSDAPLAAWVFPLIGLFMAPIYPAIVSVMLSALPKAQHAAMTGLIVVASALGGTSGSMLTGLLFDRLGGQHVFYLSLLPMTAILVTLYWFQRRASEGATRASAAGARAG